MLEKQDLEKIAEIMRPLQEDIRGVRDELRNEFKEGIGELRDELRSEFKEGIGELRNELRSEFKEGIEGVRSELKEEIGDLRSELKEVKFTLENETNRNIQIIAEAHLDLSRKLNEVLKLKEDDEMIRLRLNRLEREVQTLKMRNPS